MKTALLVSASTPLRFVTSHSSAGLQQRCIAPKPVVFVNSLYQCGSVMQDENSIARQCNHDYELLHVTQVCIISAEVHSTKAWESIYTHHTSAAL